jgi:hypothetical protein
MCGQEGYIMSHINSTYLRYFNTETKRYTRFEIRDYNFDPEYEGDYELDDGLFLECYFEHEKMVVSQSTLKTCKIFKGTFINCLFVNCETQPGVILENCEQVKCSLT